MHTEIKKTPWGQWEVLLDESLYKVKRIRVEPGKRLSYQKHSKRREHWMVVEGTAKVTLDDQEFQVPTGKTVDIEIGQAHRIETLGDVPMVFIEIQTGSYFGEDDIVRLQDDYGRTS